MQTASIPAPYPPTHPPIQNGYQPLTESEIYAIKRQYLGLLPPPQVIDICLTFEAHAPLHVKSTVWPYDIRAAIAAIHAQNAQNSPPAQQSTGDQSSPTKNPPSDASEKPPPSASEQPQSTAPGPSVANATPSSSTTPHAPPPGHLHLPPPLPQQPPPPVPHPHYPHTPYYHPSYPHAPYYPVPPSAHFSFPHPFPSFPHPPQTHYQQNIPPPSSTHPAPLFTTAPLAHLPHPPDPTPSNPVDDLPSYEEMIVEALIDSGDPEGCAPKALFSWMASHYPLQSNFRPSASQALQKAFKRGRLEKGNNGKYRLNGSWEGGNTSKRTTRRPQTNVQTTLSSHQGHPSSSPFTHAPLVHDANAGSSSSQPRPSAQDGQASHYYGFSFQGPSTSVTNTRPQSGPLEIPEGQVREGSDAWEAAQNILKAINFGQLFQMSSEDGVTHADTAAVAQVPPPVFASSVEAPPIHDGQVTAALMDPSLQSHNAETLLRTELSGDERAALQAQLALLAVQLAEFADVGEDELAQDLRLVRSNDVTASIGSTDPPNPIHPPTDHMNDEDDEDDDMDMVEVSVPTASLTA